MGFSHLKLSLPAALRFLTGFAGSPLALPGQHHHSLPGCELSRLTQIRSAPLFFPGRLLGNFYGAPLMRLLAAVVSHSTHSASLIRHSPSRVFPAVFLVLPRSPRRHDFLTE